MVDGGRLRLGFVGCGTIAQWHLAAARNAASRTDITATIDTDRDRAEAMAKETGAQPFTSFDDALNDDACDAVLVMVPPRFHEQLAVAALQAGKHVLLEKPMAPTLDACDRILGAAKHAPDTVFLVAENAQFWPEVVRVRELIQEGAVGDIITARAWHCLPPMPGFYDGAHWRMSSQATGGGVTIHAGLHWLRPLRMWLGEIDEVVAVTGHPFQQMEGESLCRALCRFDTGPTASFDVILSPGPTAPLPLFQVTGTTGELVVDGIGPVKHYDGADPRGTIVGQGSYLESHNAQIAAFEAAVLDGAPPAATADYSLGELRAVPAMYRSAQTHRWEPVW